MTRWISTDIYRTLILTILAGLAVLIVSMANRDVYAKSEIDDKFCAQKEVEDARFEGVEWRIEHIQKDVEWLVRTQGGVPSADSDAR